jgi:hypothetical protein
MTTGVINLISLRELRDFIASMGENDLGARDDILQFIDRRWPGVAPK